MYLQWNQTKLTHSFAALPLARYLISNGRWLSNQILVTRVLDSLLRIIWLLLGFNVSSAKTIGAIFFHQTPQRFYPTPQRCPPNWAWHLKWRQSAYRGVIVKQYRNSWSVSWHPRVSFDTRIGVRRQTNLKILSKGVGMRHCSLNRSFFSRNWVSLWCQLTPNEARLWLDP